MRFHALAIIAALLVASDARSQEPADEYAAIRQRVQSYVDAYNGHDAAALAALWADDAVYLNRDTGEPVEGRAAIAAMFDEMFKSGEASQLSVTVQSIRLITPDVAIEDGSAEITPEAGEAEKSTYTAIHVKKDGNWFLNSVRETDTPTPAPEEEPEELSQLAWMVGEWVDEDENATVRTSCDWAKNKHFLTSNFTVSVHGQIDFEGTQVIGWDPVAGRIRSWLFDSDGGFGEGVWQRVGDEWIVETTSTMSDGSQGSAKNVYKPVDENSFKWKSVDREVDDEQQPDIEEVPIRRDVPEAK
jgi:uncharacterized protein (TIGR02246 family)